MFQNRRRPQPPRRPKPDVKAAARRTAWWRQFGSEWIQGLAIGALTSVFFAQLMATAIANPAPVAVPGDSVLIHGMARWPAMSDPIPVRQLARPGGQPGRQCVLDLARMERQGGVLDVRAVRVDGVMLAWAGGPTASPRDACEFAHGGILITDDAFRGLLMQLAPRH